MNDVTMPSSKTISVGIVIVATMMGVFGIVALPSRPNDAVWLLGAALALAMLGASFASRVRGGP